MLNYSVPCIYTTLIKGLFSLITGIEKGPESNNQLPHMKTHLHGDVHPKRILTHCFYAISVSHIMNYTILLGLCYNLVKLCPIYNHYIIPLINVEAKLWFHLIIQTLDLIQSQMLALKLVLHLFTIIISIIS